MNLDIRVGLHHRARHVPNVARLLRKMVSIVAAITLFMCANSVAYADDNLSPEGVMTRFLHSFVAYDYETCRSLLAPGATIAIVRRDGGDEYEHSFQPAADWLDGVEKSGVKDLDSFSVEIRDAVTVQHAHGATVIVKFTAAGNTGAYGFASSGFDTGNLIETPDGWRILHYSSFEEFLPVQPQQD